MGEGSELGRGQGWAGGSIKIDGTLYKKRFVRFV